MKDKMASSVFIDIDIIYSVFIDIDMIYSVSSLHSQASGIPYTTITIE